MLVKGYLAFLIPIFVWCFFVLGLNVASATPVGSIVKYCDPTYAIADGWAVMFENEASSTIDFDLHVGTSANTLSLTQCYLHGVFSFDEPLAPLSTIVATFDVEVNAGTCLVGFSYNDTTLDNEFVGFFSGVSYSSASTSQVLSWDVSSYDTRYGYGFGLRPTVTDPIDCKVFLSSFTVDGVEQINFGGGGGGSTTFYVPVSTYVIGSSCVETASGSECSFEHATVTEATTTPEKEVTPESLLALLLAFVIAAGVSSFLTHRFL